MTDKQLIRFATEFRAGILGDRSSRMMCAAVCWPLASLLSLHGVKAEAVESDLGENWPSARRRLMPRAATTSRR